MLGWIISVVLTIAFMFNHEANILIAAAIFSVAGSISFVSYSLKDGFKGRWDEKTGKNGQN